jgi:hypothetical protein
MKAVIILSGDDSADAHCAIGEMCDIAKGYGVAVVVPFIEEHDTPEAH